MPFASRSSRRTRCLACPAVRSTRGEAELVQAAAAGYPAAGAALWDAYGPAAYAFSHRVLGEPGAAADAAQDAFLIAHAELPRLQREGEGFGVASLRAARTTSFELLGRSTPTTPRGRLSAATARLRPQQRAALALAGLERLSYAEIATVLGIALESVSALLARARLRLHDELHGTALAAAAVRSPDCEDVLPLLAAAADGELEAADAAWADPHVERCPTCVRTIRAMDEAAATYAAWSPAPAPPWLREATLADLAAEAPATATTVSLRAALPAALIGATCVTGAFAALLVGTARSLHEEGPSAGGARLPDGAGSMQLAASSVATPRRHRERRAEHADGARSATVVVARAAQPVAPLPAVRHTSAPVLRPQRTRRPATAPSAPAPAQTPVSGDAPPDQPSVEADAATTTAVAASTPPTPPTSQPTEPPPATQAPPSKVDVATPPPPVPAADDDSWAAGVCGWHDRRRD
jgi:DNA-directed RNA polymerase specialized sigma24 family protein